MTAPPKRKEEGMRVGLNQAQMTLLHAVQHSKEPYRLTAMDMVDELMQPLSWFHCSKHVMSVGTERYRHKLSSSSVIKGGLGPGEERNTHQWEFYLQCCPTNRTRGTKGNVTRNERQNITVGTFIVNARKNLLNTFRWITEIWRHLPFKVAGPGISVRKWKNNAEQRRNGNKWARMWPSSTSGVGCGVEHWDLQKCRIRGYGMKSHFKLLII